MSVPDSSPNNRLGDVLRDLMERRNLNGLVLSETIGISPTSVSRILNGVSRPRQGTLTKLMQALCRTPDDQQQLLKAYSGLPDILEEEPAYQAQDAEISTAELDRIARYLELKTLSIDFRESVARALRDGGIVFESYARSGNVVTDFLVAGPPKIAIECKFNVNRDWEREIGTAHLLLQHLPCDRVVVVVPYINALAIQVIAPLASKNAVVLSMQDLVPGIINILNNNKP